MRTLLIVSPRFPPVNAPDMQRVRVSLPYFAEYGWKPVVLTVDPKYLEGVEESLLTKTVPENVLIRRAWALPVRWTRKFGVGTLGLRALPFLHCSGLQMIRKHHIDLIYFSTTVFHLMALGRVWKAQTGVPFVLDMQDPWLSEYYDNKPKSEQPPKYWLAQRMHRTLEPWTMQQADGLIAVSRDYIDVLCHRYPWIADKPSQTLPFGASEIDFQVVHANPQENRFFRPDRETIHGVYVGRGGADMAHALRIIFGAFRIGLQENPSLFSRVRLHFIGTDYAAGDRARKSVEPIAEALGVGEFVFEHPQRIPYFETLQLLLESDFLLVPGSDDPQYSASKIYPYIMSRKPILAVFHANSSVVDVLRQTKAGAVLPFTADTSIESSAQHCFGIWQDLLKAIPFAPETDWAQFEPYTAREMTRRQCELFDQVLAQTG